MSGFVCPVPKPAGPSLSELELMLNMQLNSGVPRPAVRFGRSVHRSGAVVRAAFWRLMQNGRS